MCVVCWTLYACGGGPADGETSERLLHHLGETCEILFFLMGAMTIVEIVDANGGFYFVQDALATKSKRTLLWRITFMTFFLSAILDNLTTSIVMVMVLRKLVADSKDRMLFGGMIIIAANAGGAFSPIGDVTTIMLWIKGHDFDRRSHQPVAPALARVGLRVNALREPLSQGRAGDAQA